MNTRIIILVYLLLNTGFTFGQNLFDSNSNFINTYFNIQSEADQYVSNFYLYQSSVEILQVGNYNQTAVESNSKDVQSIIQNGDANLFERYTYYNSQACELQVIQNGNNNTILIFGQNDLSNQMQIIQNTQHQTLIINNF